MPRKHTLVVALSLAFAAVVGTVALAKTVHLGRAASAKPVPRAVIARRSKQLDRFEASLRAQLRRTPPAIPKLPLRPAASATPAASVPAPASRQRVVYVRPAPIVVRKHRAGGEHDSEGDGNRGDIGDD
jgi:hypothetical protein